MKRRFLAWLHELTRDRVGPRREAGAYAFGRLEALHPDGQWSMADEYEALAFAKKRAGSFDPDLERALDPFGLRFATPREAT